MWLSTHIPQTDLCFFSRTRGETRGRAGGGVSAPALQLPEGTAARYASGVRPRPTLSTGRRGRCRCAWASRVCGVSAVAASSPCRDPSLFRGALSTRIACRAHHEAPGLRAAENAVRVCDGGERGALHQKGASGSWGGRALLPAARAAVSAPGAGGRSGASEPPCGLASSCRFRWGGVGSGAPGLWTFSVAREDVCKGLFLVRRFALALAWKWKTHIFNRTPFFAGAYFWEKLPKCLRNHRSASPTSFPEDGDRVAFVEDLLHFTRSNQPSWVTQDQTLIPAITY